MQIKLNFKNFGFFLIFLFFVYLIYLLTFSKAANPKLPDLSIDIRDLINYCIFAAESGGYAVNRVQKERSYWKSSKVNQSSGLADELLTKADLVSNQLIRDVLDRAPGLQIISEEKASMDDSLVEKYKLNNYFLWTKHRQYIDLVPSEKFLLSDIAVWVDPLDATQEFTEGLLQYVTVMLCVTVRGKPKFGVIHRPFTNETSWGLVGYGTHPNYSSSILQPSSTKPLVAVVSRSHAGKVGDFLTKSLGTEASRFQVEPAGGSGYKSLRVVNGTATMYLHVTPIKKWDLCAPDAMIRAAGGRMTTLDGDDLTYLFQDKKIVNDRGLLVTLNEFHFKYLAKFSSIWNDGNMSL